MVKYHVASIKNKTSFGYYKLSYLGFLSALLGYHVELGDPVLFHRHRQRDSVLLDQHLESLAPHDHHECLRVISALRSALNMGDKAFLVVEMFFWGDFFPLVFIHSILMPEGWSHLKYGRCLY